MAKTSKKVNKKTDEKSTRKTAKQTAPNTSNKKGRFSGTGTPEKRRSKPVQKTELVSKVSAVHKRGTPKQLSGNIRVDPTAKSIRGNRVVSKGKKGSSKATVQSIPKIRKGFGSRAEGRTTQSFRTNKEGKRIKQIVKLVGPQGKEVTKSVGYRENFFINLPKGDLNKKIDAIQKDNFKWIEKPLKKFKPFKTVKPPRAAVIKIVTKAGKEIYFSGGISDPDFVVNKANTKQLIIDRINEYKNNWIDRVSGKFAGGIEPIKGKKRQTSKRRQEAKEAAQRMEEESGTTLMFDNGTSEETGSSYKAIFDPNNIAGVSVSFVY
jgi:hypothetical protein